MDQMDEIKTVPRSRQRIASLPAALTEPSNSFEKLEHSSSYPKLQKPGARRHSVHVPCASLNDGHDGFKNLVNPAFVASFPKVKAHPFELQARKPCFPLLNGAQQNDVEPIASKAKIKVGKRNSCTWSRSSSEREHPLSLDSKSVLPEIGTKESRAMRRQSLPISTENVTELVSSVSYRQSPSLKDATANPLPPFTQPENHNLQLKSKDCLRVNGMRPCEEGTTIPDKRDRAEAMRKHVKKAENGYNDNEMRAARLFEWLKDQTDQKNETT